MSDTPQPAAENAAAPAATTPAPAAAPNSISDPAKLIRLGTMAQTLMAEVREMPDDEEGRLALARIHRETREELETVLSPDLIEELQEFTACCDDDGVPSAGELRVAQAQLVGWLQGLMQGLQASFAAQQAMAAQQLAELRPGAQQGGGQTASGPPPGGVYL